jgi:4-hydroxy-4-methyl-2-oxoglutarate aldolase
MASDSNLHRVRALSVCDLSDALDTLGLPPAVTGLVATSAARPIAGRAVTVKLMSGQAPGGAPRHLCTAAVEVAGPDSVIVVEQRTAIDAASWGGLLSQAARYRGISGTIVDGPVRDVEESNAIGYTVYARSMTARTARGRIHEAECQTPIRLGDTIVGPGDYVAIDRSGCVVIPQTHVEQVLATAEQILTKSQVLAKTVQQGMPVSQAMDAGYETMLQRLEALS